MHEKMYKRHLEPKLGVTVLNNIVENIEQRHDSKSINVISFLQKR